MASPILPDGTLLSLPIPDTTIGTTYKDLYYKGQSFERIICQLHPKFDFVRNRMYRADINGYSGGLGLCRVGARNNAQFPVSPSIFPQLSYSRR